MPRGAGSTRARRRSTSSTSTAPARAGRSTSTTSAGSRRRRGAGPARRRPAQRRGRRRGARGGRRAGVLGTAALADPALIDAADEHPRRADRRLRRRAGGQGRGRGLGAGDGDHLGRADRRARRARGAQLRLHAGRGRRHARGAGPRRPRAPFATPPRRPAPRSSTRAASARSSTCDRWRRSALPALAGVIVGRALYEGRFTVAGARGREAASALASQGSMFWLRVVAVRPGRAARAPPPAAARARRALAARLAGREVEGPAAVNLTANERQEILRLVRKLEPRPVRPSAAFSQVRGGALKKKP